MNVPVKWLEVKYHLWNGGKPVANLHFTTSFDQTEDEIELEALRLYREAGEPYGKANRAYKGMRRGTDEPIETRIIKVRGQWRCEKCGHQTVKYWKGTYFCVDCDEKPTEEKKGTEKTCFHCGKPYLARTWFDPSGCPHCFKSFVD